MTHHDLESFSQSLDELFARLGVPNPRIQAEVSAAWEELAGKPWVGRSRPVIVRGTTLVVEADAASMVAFLRYSEASLVKALAGRFGEGVITDIEVVAPGRG